MRSATIAGVALVATLSLPACSTGPTAESPAPSPELVAAVQDQPFYDWTMTDLTKRVQSNPNYRRIPIDTEAAQSEFTGWLHALYRKQMTPAQFKQAVLQRYPGHENEVDFIVSALPPASQR